MMGISEHDLCNDELIDCNATLTYLIVGLSVATGPTGNLSALYEGTQQHRAHFGTTATTYSNRNCVLLRML
jgi:hypothetical protein